MRIVLKVNEHSSAVDYILAFRWTKCEKVYRMTSYHLIWKRSELNVQPSCIIIWLGYHINFTSIVRCKNPSLVMNCDLQPWELVWRLEQLPQQSSIVFSIRLQSDAKDFSSLVSTKEIVGNDLDMVLLLPQSWIRMFSAKIYSQQYKYTVNTRKSQIKI